MCLMAHRVSMEHLFIAATGPRGNRFLQLPMFPWKQTLHSHNSPPWKPLLEVIPCFHGNNHFAVTTLFCGNRHSQLPRVSMETTIHSHNTLLRNPSLAATPCSMETAIHSHDTFPWKQPLASAPFCMETPFDRHNRSMEQLLLHHRRPSQWSVHSVTPVSLGVTT